MPGTLIGDPPEVPVSGEQGTLHFRVAQGLLFIEPLLSRARDLTFLRNKCGNIVTDTENYTK